MTRTLPPQFRKNLLALAVGAALAPSTTWALDLVQSPPLPTQKSGYVAPNVIISVDDSGSMAWGVKSGGGSSSTGAGYTEPDANGKWRDDARRINVLKYALKTVFSDTELIPDNKIRLAWQALWKSGAKSVDSSTMQTNSMRPLPASTTTGHRKNFLDFVNSLTPDANTPSHLMFAQADAYMRRPLSKNSPWSSNPGGSDAASTEYLGCRRNYHIMMTDGRWNTGTPTGGSQDDVAQTFKDAKAYDITSDQTNIYRDVYSNTLADWAFKSWAVPLQDPTKLKDADKLKPSKVYEDAPATETFAGNVTITTTTWEKQCTKYKKNGKCDKWEDVEVTTTETKSKSVDLQKYWNPKYNPATWPHMVTYTIGFSNDAVTWPDAPDITAPSQAVPFNDNGSFPNLVTGLQQWPDMDNGGEGVRSLDLWHSAINGRGRFYAVTAAEDLAKAFREIIGKINEESAPLPDKIAAGGTSSGYNVSQNNAGLFASVYNPKDGWSGSITATRAREPVEYACPTKDDPAAKCLKFPDPISAWEGKTTAQRLDELTTVSNRLILTWSDKWASTKATGGVPFKWATDDSNLSTAQKALLGKETSDTTATVATKGENILNFIRGDRSLEGISADKPLRVRSSRQGDIVNSEIWYTGTPISSFALAGYSAFAKAQKDRIPMLYAGGNDGMLHGFSAKDGKEQIAYVPRGVIAGLKNLAEPNYVHQYYVDGSPMTGDVNVGTSTPDWRTLLVGTLGAGGKGYFVLDVTNPAGFATASAANLVVLDRTRGNSETTPNCAALTGAEKTACTTAADEDKDIGSITAQPVRNPSSLQEATQITRMNNGRWAVVLGNGYNSANQRPVLLVQYLDGSRELKRIQATTDATGAGNAKDNGLAAPTLVDLNGDGKTDLVYAGDNLGNLWKFDLNSDTDTDWAVAFGTNKPLFTARGLATLTSTTRDQVQPITAPPVVRANDREMTVGTGTSAKTVAVGGVMVAFGTGRNLTADDRRTDIAYNVQTLYSVLDNTRYRKKTGANYLEVHPGTGDCADKPATCVPTPAPVGTMATDGKPLAKQAIATVSGEFATVNATQELKKETWKDYKGWYLDLPKTGERLLKPMQFYDGSNIVAVYSESPSGTKSSTSDNINESCVPTKVDTSAGSQWRTLVNIMDGKRPLVQLVDMDGNGIFNSDDKNVSRRDVPTGTPTLITKGPRIEERTGGGAAGGAEVLNRMPETSMRPSWRQLK